MKALKGLFIYIGIVLVIIFLICAMLFGLMYFLPQFRIMGVGVIHNNTSTEGDPIVLSEYADYDNIELSVSSKKLPIYVVPDDEARDITYSLSLATFGITFDITEYRIIKDIEVKDSTLKISLTTTEPDGWISMSGSAISVTVPSKKSYAIVGNTDSASIYLGTDRMSLPMNRLSISTKTGNLYVRENTKNDEPVTLDLDSLNLNTDSGKMDFSRIAKVAVSTPIKLSSTKGEFVFNEIDASLDVRGTGVSLTASSIDCNSEGFTFMSENGAFRVGTLNSPSGAENTIITDTCSVNITTLHGKSGIITTSGSITIEEIKDEAILQSTHGAIKVAKANKEINVLTHYGDITVDAYEKTGIFTSKKGNITVNSTGDYEHGIYTQIENVDGKITIVNKANKLRLKTLGSSSVTVTFEQVVTGLNPGTEQVPGTTFEHSIVLHEKGSGVVYLPSSHSIRCAFKFMAKGNISGSISGLVDIYEGSAVVAKDTYQYYPDNSETSITGSTETCYFLFDGTIELRSYVAPTS